LARRDRLSQMILDKVFHGVLDQGRGCLLVFDEAETNVCCRIDPVLFACSCCQDTYGAAIETLEEVSKVVDSLYAKVGVSRSFYGPC
jgi:26S proteasome regulatory subunit N6